MALNFYLKLISGLLVLAPFECNADLNSGRSAASVSEVLSTELSHPRVTAIAEDGFGHIWVGTAHGLNKHLGYGYHQYFAGDDSLSLHDNHIASLFCDTKRRLWVMTLDGGLYQHTDIDTFASVPMDFHGISLPQMVELPNGDILCNTERQIFRYNEHNRQMETVIPGTDLNIGCFVSSSGNLIVVYPRKIRYFDTENFSLLEEISLPAEFQNASMDPDGALWLLGFGQLVRMNPSDGKLENAPVSLSKEVSKGRLMEMLASGGGMLINTRSSLIQYDPIQGEMTVSADPSSPFFTADYDINCLFKDSRDNLWLGLNGGGIMRVGHGLSHTGLHPLLEYFRNMSISSLKWTGDVLTINAGKNNIYHYDPDNGSVRKIMQGGPELPFGIGLGKDLRITLSDGGYLETGYDKDLRFVQPSGESAIPAKRLIEAAGGQHFVPDVLFEDSRGAIWIGTQSSGLFLLSPDRSRLEKIEKISCEEISSIQEDLSGNVWVGTQYGLNEYTPEGELVGTYTAGNGISSNAFTENAACRLPDGTLLFGTMQGIVARFFSEDHPEETASLLFEGLKVQNRMISPGKSSPVSVSMNYSPEVSLSHSQNSFSISYASLDYSNASQASYQYKLEGLDSFWVDAGNSHEAFYSNVPAGRYTFMVRLANAGGEPVSEAITLPVRIFPAPWATWWAKMLYALAFAALLFGIVYTWLQHQRKLEEGRRVAREKEQEQRTNEINKRYFANVAHQLRTPLTMISGPLGTLYESDTIKGSNKNLLKIIRHNTDRMLHLVNQIMDFNALETDALALKVRRTDILPILRNTLDIYEVNAQEKGITFLSDGLEGNAFVYADADKIVNILDNLLSNAFKYAPAGGFISVSFTEMTDNITLKVSNSGPTIPENKLERIFERYYQIDGATQEGRYNWGSGVGLYYARKLAELHHGTLVCTNAEDSNGVCFTLSFPSGKESYSQEETDNGLSYKTLDQEQVITQSSPDTNDDYAELKPFVLVVDDDSDITFYLRTLLSPYYQVSCCYDVDSAEALLQQRIPDIILSDIMMNGQTGYDFCNFLKEDLQYCHIPVVLLTAKDSVKDQIDGLKVGADAYVTKPFNAEYLLSLMDNLLKGRERLRKALTENAGLDIPSDNTLSSQDKSFLKDLYDLMETELSNSEFNIGDIVEKLHISHSKFIYKVKGLTGTTPSELFKNYKLNKAASMLQEGKYNVSEVADLTGFSSLAHFSKVFKKKFGVSPSEYQ